MLPILLRIGPFAIASHDVFVLLGVVTALSAFLFDARRRGVLDERLGWIAIGSILTGAVAAKLSTLWLTVAAAPDSTILWALVVSGKSILGGLAGAYLGAIVTKKIIGYRESTGDLFAPAVAIGLAVGRIGCFLSEQVGTPTSLPWGITVDAQTAERIPMCGQCAPGVPMHPSFLYEIAFHAVMFTVLRRLVGLVPVRGDVFKLYLLAYAMFRFAVEFVRGNPSAAFGLSFSQLFLIPATLALLAYFGRQVFTRAYALPSFDPTA
jgi:phosphatidylglycerol:prolipoprotein diacylglycerol transferase